MKRHIALLIFALILLLSGLGLIWYYSNWGVALGVFLVIWGGNAERGSR